MNAMFRRLRFTAAAATALVDEQNLDTLEEIRNLTNDEVSTLCKIIRRPGGFNAGIPISFVAETNLKQACYYIYHQSRVSRPMVPGGVTLAGVRALRDYRDAEANYNEPDPSECPQIDKKDSPKTLENI